MPRFFLANNGCTECDRRARAPRAGAHSVIGTRERPESVRCTPLLRIFGIRRDTIMPILSV